MNKVNNPHRMLGRYNYTKPEMDSLLDSIIILMDTREQKNAQIIKYCDDKKIKYQSKKLDFADYSFKLPKNEKAGILRDLYFDKQIVIEKKNGLMELIGNLCEDGGARLKSEFIRSAGSKFYLMIENALYEDIVNGNYEITHGNKSKYLAKSLLGRIKTFEARHDINVVFMNSLYSGNFIYHTFRYWLREQLLKGIDYDIPTELPMSELPAPE